MLEPREHHETAGGLHNYYGYHEPGRNSVSHDFLPNGLIKPSIPHSAPQRTCEIFTRDNPVKCIQGISYRMKTCKASPALPSADRAHSRLNTPISPGDVVLRRSLSENFSRWNPTHLLTMLRTFGSK
jgi:hypothetical protein